MYIYHLLYDINFHVYDMDDEKDIPLSDIKKLLLDINQSIKSYFNFDFHLGMALRENISKRVAWALPHVDVFEGQSYFVVECGLYDFIDLSKNEIMLFTEAFSDYDNWQQHFSINYQGLPVYTFIDWKNVNPELSGKYKHSTHYKLYDCMNTPMNPMTIESSKEIRTFFYQLRNKYPEIDVWQSKYTYEATRRSRYLKFDRLLRDALDREENNLSDNSEHRVSLALLAETYEIYKSLKQWSSQDKLDLVEHAIKIIANNTGAEVTAFTQQFVEVQKAVNALREQMHDLCKAVSLLPNISDELKRCLNDFLV